MRHFCLNFEEKLSIGGIFSSKMNQKYPHRGYFFPEGKPFVAPKGLRIGAFGLMGRQFLRIMRTIAARAPRGYVARSALRASLAGNLNLARRECSRLETYGFSPDKE